MPATKSIQQPVGSTFPKRATAAEVLDGIDLSGRHFVVTGGASGLGIEVTRALVGAGARVTVPARRPGIARGALAEAGVGTGEVVVEDMDLTDLASVAAFARRTVACGVPLDGLVNAAGVMACPETRVGPGWELQLATNHLGHYALTNGLWSALEAGGARVVTFSSGGHRLSPFRFEDPHFTAAPYDKWEAYGQAKTANVLFTVWLDQLGRDAGVRAFAVHPGRILTPLMRHMSREELLRLRFIDDDGNLTSRMKTPEQGASTAVWAATSRALDGLGGLYCEDNDVAPVADEADPQPDFIGVCAHATDEALAERLWRWSAEQAGVDAFGLEPTRRP